MRKQKLSPEASKAKAVRDKKIAMTPHRKKRKRDNERMGQRSDSDIHHPSGGGPAVRVSIKNNRGNFGKGTKIEGPNMMGQTWLNRKINGPSAVGGEGDEGDPTKQKNINLSTTFQGKKSSVTPSIMFQSGKPTSASLDFNKQFKRGEIGGGISKSADSPTNINLHATVRLNKKGPNAEGDPTKKANRQARRDGRNDHNTPEKINYRKPETDDWKTQAEWDQVSKAELENLNPISKLRNLVKTKYFFKTK